MSNLSGLRDGCVSIVEHRNHDPILGMIEGGFRAVQHGAFGMGALSISDLAATIRTTGSGARTGRDTYRIQQQKQFSPANAYLQDCSKFFLTVVHICSLITLVKKTGLLKEGSLTSAAAQTGKCAWLAGISCWFGKEATEEEPEFMKVALPASELTYAIVEIFLADRIPGAARIAVGVGSGIFLFADSCSKFKTKDDEVTIKIKKR